VFDNLVHWITEREAIRLRKESGEPFPWTEDPILRQYRFCNVRREDDRVTVWVRDNIRVPYWNHPHLWWMLCAARSINWPATLRELMLGESGAWPSHSAFKPEYLRYALEHRKARGDKVYTGAYMIRAENHREAPWFSWSKQRYIAEIVLGRPWEARDRFPQTEQMRTLHQVWAWLSSFMGWGPFMAYQAVVDMRFTPILNQAPDRLTWCAAGPGTIRGLNRLAGRPVKSSLSQSKALDEILALYEKLIPLFVDNRSPGWLDLSDVPNVCCEFDKYMRVKDGEGRPRALYVPGRGS